MSENSSTERYQNEPQVDQEPNIDTVNKKNDELNKESMNFLAYNHDFIAIFLFFLNSKSNSNHQRGVLYICICCNWCTYLVFDNIHIQSTIAI